MMRLILLLFGMILLFGCQDGDQASSADPDRTADWPDFTGEQHRPQFHFSPPVQWMNDPNGMVYYEGEYHLFYQHYPDSTIWGPMHWGHAVSTDLVHWEHLPIALYPDSLGYIFSGSAVVDWNNTSGLGQDGQPPLVAIFTHHDPVGEKSGANDFQYQSLAFSNDKGRTWTKYDGNPVVPNPGIRDFRDPKVIWHEDSQQWIMVFAAWDHVKFYGSPNLLDWTHLSDFGREWGTHAGVWECPDLFPMPVEGSDEEQWVLLVSINPGSPNGGSGTQYFVGQFDGERFLLDDGFQAQLGAVPAYHPEGTVFADFENGYGEGWAANGPAFGEGPARGALPNQNPVTGYTGAALVNSFRGGDEATGVLASPVFTIDHDFINFQIAGGRDFATLRMELIVDKKVVRTASGNYSENLSWEHWDVAELHGQPAMIRLIDDATGGWGHLCVDQIEFSDEAARPASEKAVWLDYGRDNYAGVTWSDIPPEDGRRIFIGWMSNWAYANVVPTGSWRSAMTLPRELSLQQTNGHYRLYSVPVEELAVLRTAEKVLEAGLITENQLLPISAGAAELELSIELVDETAHFGIELSNQRGERYRIGYDAATNSFYSDRREAGNHSFSDKFAAKAHTAPRLSTDGPIRMQLFLDVASVELFADGGATVLTDIFFPSQVFDKAEIYLETGQVKLLDGRAYTLKSIWQ
ncbi:MAG: glycoside hydrolase family 32 protein [Lewinella sp.]|nr:glycoside hydrolase family 32 protein [Lewinella sp.]